MPSPASLLKHQIDSSARLAAGLAVCALVLGLLAACANPAGGGTTLSSAKAITAFSLALPASATSTAATVSGTISGTAVALTVPAGTDVTALVASFISTGAAVRVGGLIQTSGSSANNFAGPVSYLVSAADGSTLAYTVTVTVTPSPSKAITAFSLALPASATSAAATVSASISGTAIAVTVPFGTNVSALVASFTTTGASVAVGGVAQTSGSTANNFGGPVSYVVTAADGSTMGYTVTVTVALSSAKAITAFSFASPATTGIISGTSIALSVPAGTSVGALVASFSTTGASVKVGGVAQTSGSTANNFASPVSYLVTAADGSSQSYTVTLSFVPWVSTLAGSGIIGSSDGTGSAASLNYPFGVAVDGSGNVYIADTENNRIRKITPTGEVSTLAGSGTTGNTDGTGSAASFLYLRGVAADTSGDVYVADFHNAKIRKITPAGLVSTLAGSGTAGTADGIGSAASFTNPFGVAVDGSGNVYVADYSTNRIRKISPAGVVSTLAGSGAGGGTDGNSGMASFRGPNGVAIDGSGNVYVADTFNHKIRKITPAGLVSTLAGSGTSGSSDGTGSAASFASPYGVAVDASGNVYVADSGNHKIRKITPAGLVSTLAGLGSSGSADGAASAASFASPHGVAIDAGGNVYVADTYNHKIRKIVQ